jgi:hypothetical protein
MKQAKESKSTANSGKNNGKRGRVENLKPFKPGQSGNPSGRPKKTPLTDLYKELLDSPEIIAEVRNSVRAMVKSGRMVGMLQLKEMAERVEGKVTQPIEVEVSISERIRKARERRANS